MKVDALNEKQQPIITASEVADYVYCKRGWWLMSQGMLSQNTAMLDGTRAHDQLSLLLVRHKILSLIALILIGIGLIGLVIVLSFRFLF